MRNKNFYTQSIPDLRWTQIQTPLKDSFQKQKWKQKINTTFNQLNITPKYPTNSDHQYL